MIKFQRRRLRMWVNTIPFDIVDYMDDPQVLEFENEEQLIQFIHSAAPFTKSPTPYSLEINGRSVISGSAIGWIID